MRGWTSTDEDLALELQSYYARARLYGAGTPWTIDDKGKPWTDYYSHTSELLRKMRASRRKRVEAKGE
jgi:hypothetical protein